MSPRFVLVNAVMLGVAGLFAFEVYRAVSRPRAVPPAPVSRAAQPATSEASGATRTEGVRQDQRPAYSVIATKNLFSPSRSETQASTGPAGAPPAARPLLHGVVLNDGKSRAYLEDPASKKVFGYAVGDQVGGGRLEVIRDDRVVIVRPEGPIEVMLRDPAKPRPAPAPPSPGAPRPGAGASGPQIVRPTPAPGVSGAPLLPGPSAISPRSEAQPTAPRTLQSPPPDFLRRRAPAVPGSAPGAPGG